jgi:hypothetical protein
MAYKLDDLAKNFSKRKLGQSSVRKQTSLIVCDSKKMLTPDDSIKCSSKQHPYNSNESVSISFSPTNKDEPRTKKLRLAEPDITVKTNKGSKGKDVEGKTSDITNLKKQDDDSSSEKEIKGILVYYRGANKRKKSVAWKTQADLVSIRLFEENHLRDMEGKTAEQKL